MTQYPLPSINPFERFQASDGILVNATRWKYAHDYHRRKQCFFYQTLYQPGIVSGLGLKILNGGSQGGDSSGERPLVEIQPGIAIDYLGNPIIIPESQAIYIDKEPNLDKPLTIYLVVSYQDPDDLENPQNTDLVREQFRIDVKSDLPNIDEIEICRILIPAGDPIYLSVSQNVFLPGAHCLDFRFRNTVTLRPQKYVRIAQVKHAGKEYNRNFINLTYLLKATSTLYFPLEGIAPVGLVQWQEESIYDYDLLYVTGSEFRFNQQDVAPWQNYLITGGVIVVDLRSNENSAVEYMQNFLQNELKIALKPLPERHLLRQEPFLFSALPSTVSTQGIKVFTSEGIILILGDLGSTWGVDEKLSVPRPTIRTAQEFGVNILYHTWQRRYLTNLQLMGNG
jgi:hypothetical protein